MDLHLKDKVVVITGGGTGIGKAAAREFLREGARVWVLGRREEVLSQFAREAEAAGYAPGYESCDVTDRKAVEETADRILRENEPKLHELAAFLLERETITGAEFMSILNR